MSASTAWELGAVRVTDEARPGWLEVRQGEPRSSSASPIPAPTCHRSWTEARFVLAGAQGRRLVVDRLYAFAADLVATTVRTSLSRTNIDVNRDPSGVSL